LVCANSEIIQLNLNSGIYSAQGPSLLGIGLVPVTSIIGGYATTSPGYMFYVVNSPFGGTLAVMVNHDKGRALNAVSYRVTYDGITQSKAWNDYKWDPVQNLFVLTTTSADSNGWFPVRQASDLWENYWLGYLLDTTAYADNQLHTITIDFFDDDDNYISGGSSSVNIFVDNNWPHAYIQQIFHKEDNGTVVPVAACEIVQGTDDEFSFVIDASDQIGQNLLSWSLTAYWGANKASAVASDTYQNNYNPLNVHWLGPLYVTEPTTSMWHASVPGDPTSRACAHTFYLDVWDRSTNGYGYLHQSTYQVSLTILLS